MVRLFALVLVLFFSLVSINTVYSEGQSSDLNLPRERCTMRFVDAEVKDVLRLLAKEYKLNLIISEDVGGIITVDFEEVLLEDLFHVVLETAGLDYTVRGDVIRIVTLNEVEKHAEANKKIRETEKMVSETIRVKYILNTAATESIVKELDVEREEVRDLTQLAEALKKMLSQRKGASIEVVDAANALIITDVPDRVAEIVKIVKELDQPSPQILIEARITTIDSDYLRDLGVQWGGLWDIGSTEIGGTSLSQGTGESGAKFLTNLPAAVKAGQGGAVSIVSQINNDTLDIQLSALEDDGRANILASPRVVTQDNQKAYIKIGDEIPYLERAYGEGVTTDTVTFKDAAIELEVSPHTVGDEVFMDLVVARKTADFINMVNNQPPLRAQALTTKVSVKSGETFAIGGLTREEETTTIHAVPFFSRIPILNFFFKNETKTKIEQELVIFITPTIIGKETEEKTKEDSAKAAQGELDA